MLAAGFGVGEADDPRAFGTRDRRERRRNITVSAEQRKDVGWLHQRIRRLTIRRRYGEGRLPEALGLDAVGVFGDQGRL